MPDTLTSHGQSCIHILEPGQWKEAEALQVVGDGEKEACLGRGAS